MGRPVAAGSDRLAIAAPLRADEPQIARDGSFRHRVASSASLLAWLLIKRVAGLRVSEEEELAGLDAGEIGLKAYPEFAFTAFRPLDVGGGR